MSLVRLLWIGITARTVECAAAKRKLMIYCKVIPSFKDGQNLDMVIKFYPSRSMTREFKMGNVSLNGGA